jgi:hypothetical protein
MPDALHRLAHQKMGCNAGARRSYRPSAGFRGEIICTHATKALLVPMLHDAMSFSRRSDKEVHQLELLIDELSWGFELRETFDLKQGVTFKLRNAGHILGSCFILFGFPVDKTDLPAYRVIFSGDLGSTDTPILPDPDPPEDCYLLIMESTYGDRLHPNRKGRVEALRKLLNKALADRGIVYIPAFSLGRTQELLYELDRIDPKVPELKAVADLLEIGRYTQKQWGVEQNKEVQIVRVLHGRMDIYSSGGQQVNFGIDFPPGNKNLFIMIKLNEAGFAEKFYIRMDICEYRYFF